MVSTAEVSVYLEGITFPASKEDLIRYAHDRNAPPEVMDGLQRLPSSEFRTMAEVWRDIGKED